ncbi:PEGA domain-containing protein [Stigmatella sp. ncwal1]|uniref:PEGA domain-containing protein n=1 Tax=Stigmatella ashevillensis TaxID=2995309 RepID=A0ABT5DFE2_9BACT|nr:PEGA domain-containing protein [Stigmatella ashevillena]MDC0712395.1 PEGA domain-containing protein [Stigmatella ashevillena]
MIPLVCVLACVTHAAPRRLVVASGECKDAELNTQARAVHDALASRPGQEVLSPAAFREHFFPPPAQSVEELQVQLETAQSQFYEARHAQAEQVIGKALQEIFRLPVGSTRWQLHAHALLLQALNARATGKVKDSDAAFRSILRLEPQYKLDAGLYPPSLQQAFEKVRTELARAKKVKLSVKSTLPASEVYLDGHKAGQTPLTLELLPGSYELTVVKDGAVSFPRPLPVEGPDTPVFVDLAYEGAVSGSPFPCLAAPHRSGERTVSHALRLGGTLGVEEVIVVRLERSSSKGPQWLAATVLHVEGGQKLREGGFKIQDPEALAESLSALIDFVTTGKAPPPLVVPGPQGTAPWVPVAATDVPHSTADQAAFDVPAPHRVSEERAVTAAEPSPRTPTLRTVSYGVLGGGAAVLVGAGILRLVAQKDLDRLDKRLDANGRVDANDTEALALRDSLSAKRTLLTGLLIGSGAALTTGAVLFLVSPARAPPPPVTLEVSVDSGGASARFLGTF